MRPFPLLPIAAFALVLQSCSCGDGKTSVADQNNTETVPVSGKPNLPYVMLLVDKSGSMLDPSDCPEGGTCVQCATNLVYDPTSTNPCKWNDLKSAVASTDPANPGFIMGAKGLAHFGLAVFPSNEKNAGACDVGEVLVDLDPDQDNVDAIVAELANVLPVGGTPTAATLNALVQANHLVSAEKDRLRFVMILTDGEPNCSTSATNQQRCQSCNSSGACTGPDLCNPTFGGNSICDAAAAGSGAPCLDDTGLLDAVTALHANGVDTFIIWFGSATAQPEAAAALNKAAVAGGRPQQGAATEYYQASNKAELQQFLTDISKSIQSCTFTLGAAPDDPDLLEVVLVDTTNNNAETLLTQGTDWSLGSDNVTVQILGSACTQIQSAAPNTLEVVFRYLTQKQ